MSKVRKSWKGLQSLRHRSAVQIIRREKHKPELCANLPRIKSEKYKHENLKADVHYAYKSTGVVKIITDGLPCISLW
jgi:hypothetical protein